ADSRLHARRRHAVHARRRGGSVLEVDLAHPQGVDRVGHQTNSDLRSRHLGTERSRCAARARWPELAAAMNEQILRFTSGQQIPVAPTAIERERGRLWRDACAAGQQITRAALWNLVFRADGDEPFTRAKQLIDIISAAAPARVLVLRADASG